MFEDDFDEQALVDQVQEAIANGCDRDLSDLLDSLNDEQYELVSGMVEGDCEGDCDGVD